MICVHRHNFILFLVVVHFKSAFWCNLPVGIELPPLYRISCRQIGAFVLFAQHTHTHTNTIIASAIRLTHKHKQAPFTFTHVRQFCLLRTSADKTRMTLNWMFDARARESICCVGVSCLFAYLLLMVIIRDDKCLVVVVVVAWTLFALRKHV